ncbi:release factor glutamine methyltransferase [Barrientosiimonas humi]|uniref:Release factor glutamine methyltransferase n=1 Tax=Barrientosiimonas humi TaxID=999931 RepID=A0A542X9G2_9MICO|nr:release factor glutamine methyltransferase [Barrientosiimonas humi]CAG7572456.1 Release factor glutamine methyltransferase [Barrientosiimonas humi]
MTGDPARWSSSGEALAEPRIETPRSTIRAVAGRLRAAGVASPESDAALLLTHAWGRAAADVRRADLLGETPPEPVVERLEGLVAARVQRIPLQHLTGRAPFRDLELQVGPGVFVPRPETEMLVDLAAAGLPQGGRVVDLCTGSGAIALALAAERPDAVVAAVELDPLARAWADRNRATLGLDLDLRSGAAQDAFPELEGEVDVVVSNPPYIPVGMEPVDPEVRDHDPAVALYGGSDDGLRIPLEVAARARALLRPGGLLVMEHADVQGATLPAQLVRQGWVEVHDHDDLTGRPRAVTARAPQA